METAREEPAGLWRPLPFYRSLAFKLGLCVGTLTLLSVFVFAYFAIQTQRTQLLDHMADDALWLSDTLTSILKTSMWKNDVEGIDRVVQTAGRQRDIAGVRIFNHAGEIRFTTDAGTRGNRVDRREAACAVCHREGHSVSEVGPEGRSRVYRSPEGHRIMGLVTPLYNEKGCVTAECHPGQEAERVLGVLDVGISLREPDRAIADAVGKTIFFALSLFIGIAGLLVLAQVRFVVRPVHRLLEDTRRISAGDYGKRLDLGSRDELGVLAIAFNLMRERIRERERELEGSQREFQTLFQNVPTYVAVVNRDYHIVETNRNFTKTFGQGIGEACFRAYKGRDEKCEDCPVERTFEDGTPHRSEELGVTATGEAIHYLVHTAPVRDPEGNVQYAIEMSVDLRETKRLEKELRVSQGFVNNLIENSIHGIVAVDATARIIVFNRSAERILGYDAEEILGIRELEKVFPRRFALMIQPALGQRGEVQDLRTVAEETWLPDKSGTQVPVRFTAAALAEDGTIIGAVGFFQDLRPIKALEREKQQAERLAVVGQTVAALAHGIKNIITGLEGGVYVMETAMKRRDDALIQKGWEMLERNIGKISNQIKDLLSYSKVRVADMARVNPNGLAEEVASLFQEKARLSGIDVATDLDSQMGEASLDPKAMHTCLANLLSNALDACVEDDEKKAHRIVLRTRKETDGWVTFEVEDDGTGMDEAVRERLFTNFFSTKGTKGTGLGLMVTHKLVHEHGGRITVESEPGRGARFRIQLPQNRSQPE
jgi:histidine kinase